MKRSFGVEISLTVQRKASQFLILICCFCWCFEAWSFNQGDWANFLHEKIFPRNLVRFLLEDLLQCRQKKSFHMICWCYQMMKLSIWCDYNKKKESEANFPGWDFISFICFWLMRHKSWRWWSEWGSADVSQLDDLCRIGGELSKPKP